MTIVRPVLALLVLTLAAPLMADDVEGLASYDPKAAHEESDKNGDGQVDRREFYDRMVEVFYFADTNKDGVLEVTELTIIREPMVLETGDRNNDGKLTMKEYIHIRHRAFEAADKNDDGELSQQEVIDAFEK